jgi:exopolyphosphatase
MAFKQLHHSPLSLLRITQIILFSATIALRSLLTVDAFVRSVAPIRLLTATTSRSSSSGATNKMVTTLSAMQQQHQLQQCNTNFVSYLDSLAHSVKSESDTRRKTNVIIGNEAGDADSIISALTLGYVMSSSRNNTALLQQHVPVVSISRAEMELRRDAAILLDLVGIDIQKLLYLDDAIVKDNLLIPSASTSSEQDPDVSSLSITLVDHNRLRHMFSHLNPYVTEIIDHHQDEGYHGHVVAEYGKRNIAFANGHATVASTCTLVAERLFENMPAAADADAEVSDSIDGALGLSLLGVILLDSINMSPEAKKGTPRDEEAIQQLFKRTDWASFAESTTTAPSLVDEATIAKIFPNGRSNMPNRKALFETLIGAKSDPKFWSDMSAMNCLRIDYKKFIVDNDNDKSISIGLSSVIITMDDLLTKEGFIDSMKSFIASEDVKLFGVLGVTFDNGKPERELLLAGNDDNIVDSFSQFLLEHSDAAAMEIVEREDCRDVITSQDSMRMRVFRQGNAKGYESRLHRCYSNMVQQYEIIIYYVLFYQVTETYTYSFYRDFFFFIKLA